LNIRIFERKVLRKIWSKRHNQDLEDLFERPDIVNEIKRSKLKWAGNVCSKQNSMIKKVLQENPRSKRPLGRPRLRWEDCFRKDFLNITGEDNGNRD